MVLVKKSRDEIDAEKLDDFVGKVKTAIRTAGGSGVWGLSVVGTGQLINSACCAYEFGCVLIGRAGSTEQVSLRYYAEVGHDIDGYVNSRMECLGNRVASGVKGLKFSVDRAFLSFSFG